jgi:hypothetical protein
MRVVELDIIGKVSEEYLTGGEHEHISVVRLVGGSIYLLNLAQTELIPTWTPKGAIYDPQANTWTQIAPPAGWTSIGDAQSVVLENGTYMQANCCTTETALLNAGTLTWTPTGANKFDVNDEEGWNLLPNGQVLTVDAYVFSYVADGTNSELYNPSTGAWSSAGSTIVQLWDSAAACGGQRTRLYLLHWATAFGGWGRDITPGNAIRN